MRVSDSMFEAVRLGKITFEELAASMGCAAICKVEELLPGRFQHTPGDLCDCGLCARHCEKSCSLIPSCHPEASKMFNPQLETDPKKGTR